MGGRFDDKERTSLRMQVQVDDEAAARTLLAEWLDLIKRYPAAFKYRKPRVQTARVQGVQVHTTTTEFAGTPEEQQLMECSTAQADLGRGRGQWPPVHDHRAERCASDAASSSPGSRPRKTILPWSTPRRGVRAWWSTWIWPA